MSEDLVDYVHAHSLDILNAGDDDSEPQFLIPPGADLEKLRGGPEVTFDGLMPRPGRYRAWTQFRRNDTSTRSRRLHGADRRRDDGSCWRCRCALLALAARSARPATWRTRMARSRRRCCSIARSFGS